MSNIPQWNDLAITPGWWWLQFSDMPGPRYWDGMFWKQGGYFSTAEDYAAFPVIGPCITPLDPTFAELADRAYGWTITNKGTLAALVAGDMGYDDTNTRLGVLLIKAFETADISLSRRINDALAELVMLCQQALPSDDHKPSSLGDGS